MTNDQFDRLFKAAANASRNQPEPSIPFGLDTRVIAHWKSEAASQTAKFALFRKALAFACAVALASFALGYQTLESSPSPELAIANNAFETSFTP